MASKIRPKTDEKLEDKVGQVYRDKHKHLYEPVKVICGGCHGLEASKTASKLGPSQKTSRQTPSHATRVATDIAWIKRAKN
jgi:hypothetical protein